MSSPFYLITMNREQIQQDILHLESYTNILLKLATGVGKTKLALELIDQRASGPILIVYPKVTLKDEWLKEIKKWSKEHLLNSITFTTYASLHKHAVDKDGNSIRYSICVFDEAHHLSERKRDIFKAFNSDNNILLSATINRRLDVELHKLFRGLHTYTVSTKDAIENEILPDPTVILIPLALKNQRTTCSFIVNPKAKNSITREFNISVSNYWRLKKSKCRATMVGTPVEYHSLLCSLIEFYRLRQHNPVMKNIFLRLSGERLEWLSSLKNNHIKDILKVLKNDRTITFCSNIAQAKLLGANAIHSQNKHSEELKEKFNNGKIKHITSVAMLNEGVNLTNCKYGIWARYNTSEVMVVQKIGRILRHKTPYIVLPYFEGTREEEIISSMLQKTKSSKTHYAKTLEQFKTIIGGK